MFLGRTFSQRLEPVRDVRNAVLHGPFFHSAGHTVSGLAVEGMTTLDTVKQSMQALGIKILAHFLAVEH